MNHAQRGLRRSVPARDDPALRRRHRRPSRDQGRPDQPGPGRQSAAGAAGQARRPPAGRRRPRPGRHRGGGSRALATRFGGVDRLVGALEQLQVPLARVREQLGIPGMGVEVATTFRDKARMKDVLRAAGLPCARHRLAERHSGRPGVRPAGRVPAGRQAAGRRRAHATPSASTARSSSTECCRSCRPAPATRCCSRSSSPARSTPSTASSSGASRCGARSATTFRRPSR